MAKVFVDALFKDPRTGRRWCHMMAFPEGQETREDAVAHLKRFGKTIGLQAQWFQEDPDHPHFDLGPYYRARAVEHGAIEITSQDMVRLNRGRLSIAEVLEKQAEILEGN